ncbi:SAM-dependent methyltransferase [Caldichromatium japonicum]|uniref:SAM-dependent methyltransferase n=1 Tax=Caldichromatium japonicum TaxID=2699430 RepID=A0A6G7VBL5_9GAMM|nr:SAM-dependent methyltransferase [Caldichromatium japonicum]QIK37342.1 SAM-dependent methyltransferase [Caldichromatium japonicum]
MHRFLDADGAADAISQQLAERIRSEIHAQGGFLPFDRFMELALYAPGLGYYVAGAHKFGRGGDFVTAPELSPLFGRCLAVQCAEALERLGGGDLFEFGPGTGILAVQLLVELERLQCLPTRYWLLEPSPELQARQRAMIEAAVPHLAERCLWPTALPQGFAGVVLANEVLDAMPVHRFYIGEDGQILELAVTEWDGQLTEITIPPRSPGLLDVVRRLHALGLALAPGYLSELNLRLGPWLAAVSQMLERGLILLIDYGYPRTEYYHPSRSMGTLMCHCRHQAHPDPLVHLGLQDITAHVDFSAIAEEGTAAGLMLAGYTTQAHFLLGCGIDRYLAGADTDPNLVLGVKQLILPSGMGERFKVLALSKGVSGPWCGFSVRDLSDRL